MEPTARSRRTARLFFGVTLALFPLQLLVTRQFDEPYPALTQPAFSGSPEADDVVFFTRPSVTISHADGERLSVPYEVILPDPPLVNTTLIESGYGDEGRANRQSVRRWVRNRLAEQFPGQPIDMVEIEWLEVAHHVDTGETLVVGVRRTVQIDISEVP